MRERKSKDNKKKKKSAFRKIIKTIFMLLLLVLIAYASYFGYSYYLHKSQMGETAVYDPLSATALGINAEKLKKVGRINILVLGESDANQGRGQTPYYLTDTIIVASYNPQTQQASILSIPRDTYVGKKNKNSASANYLASYKVNSVYRNRTNINEMLECVSNLIGIELHNYIMVDTESIVEIVDAIGGVTFNVPIDMNYDDYNQDLHIHLTAGEQLIDGDKAEQLLRFRHNQDGTSYPAEYGDNDLGRMRTQREFIMETAKQLLKIENVTKVVDLINIVQKNVRTNMDLQELKYYIPYIFKFDTSTIMSDFVPGKPEQCNGIWIYSADKEKTAQIAQDLFTDKIIEEENEDSNTINENTVTDNTSDNTKLKENNAISNDTKTTGKGEKSGADLQTEKKEKNITIELLNGTANSDTLSKIKEKLKQEGYTISKSGTTTETKKTTIINRTSKSSNTSKDIKDILGVGKITEGSDNAKVDYTIIIGEDYN